MADLKDSVLQSLDLKSFYSSELSSFKLNGTNQAMGLCPFHEDKKNSFSVNLQTGLFFCHACNEKGDLFSFYQKKHSVDFKTALQELSKQAGLTEAKKVVRVYNYLDESGKLLFQVCRFEPKDFRQRRPDSKGGWIWNLQGISLIPFNLPQVVKSSYCFIVEGEKDVESLKGLGFVASCNPMGVGKWKAEFNKHFRGKRVYILPDNDMPGKEHSLQVAKSLKGEAEIVKVVELPGLPEKGDVTDWINQRQADSKTADQIKTELKEIVKTAPEWIEGEHSKAEDTAAESKNLLDSLLKWNDILTLDVHTEYLLDKLIPKGSITLLFGRGGIGKTSLCLQICRAIAEGLPYGDLNTIKTPVYYIDFENPLSVLKQRVECIGNADNIFIWHLSGNPQPPRLDTEDWILYKQLPAGLLVFDTFRGSHLLDENNSQDMAIIISKLKELREAGFTVLLLHHTPKGNEGIYKGSTAILDLVDHCLGIEELKDEETVEFGKENVYRLGVRIKTRYEPHHIFLKFNPNMKGFEVAKDPDYEIIEAIHGLLEGKDELNTNQIYELVKKELDIKNKVQALKLLKKGEGKYWETEKRGRAVYYRFKSLDIYIAKPLNRLNENGLEKSNPDTSQSLDNPIEFNSLNSIQTDGLYSKTSVQNTTKNSDSLNRCSNCMLTPSMRLLCEVQKPCPRGDNG